MIKPFDDAQVIAGQGTIGLEIATQAAAKGVERADVLIPCGGGGLTSGIALALAADAPGLTPRTVEPTGFDDVARSLASGRIQTNQRQSGSICDAIITPSPGHLTFPIMQKLCGPPMVVPEGDCLRAMADALAAAIHELAFEPLTFRAARKIHARALIEKRYSVARNLANFEQAYGSLA